MKHLHYHVMTAFPGCLPETNEVFNNKKQAMAYAVSVARDYRGDGCKVYGNAELGYEVVFNADCGSGIAIEFVTCSDLSCGENDNDY